MIFFTGLAYLIKSVDGSTGDRVHKTVRGALRSMDTVWTGTSFVYTFSHLVRHSLGLDAESTL